MLSPLTVSTTYRVITGTLLPPLYCDICEMHLCTICIGKHLSNKFKTHRVVPVRFINECLKHTSKYWEFYGMECDIPVCERYISALDYLDYGCVNVKTKLLAQPQFLLAIACWIAKVTWCIQRLYWFVFAEISKWE